MDVSTRKAGIVSETEARSARSERTVLSKRGVAAGLLQLCRTGISEGRAEQGRHKGLGRAGLEGRRAFLRWSPDR